MCGILSCFSAFSIPFYIFMDEMERNGGYGASKLKIIGIARYGRFPLLGMRNGATVMGTCFRRLFCDAMREMKRHYVFVIAV